MKEAEESVKRFQKLRHSQEAVELDINRLEYHGLDKELKGITMYCALRVLTTCLHKVENVFQEKARKRQEEL